jgi:hypothetical protein
MRRICLAVLLCVAATATQEASAAPRQRPVKRTRSGYEAIVIVRKPSGVTYRTTYPGYINGFPPPAFLYYGYPQSGFSYGVGF